MCTACSHCTQHSDLPGHFSGECLASIACVLCNNGTAMATAVPGWLIPHSTVLVSRAPA